MTSPSPAPSSRRTSEQTTTGQAGWTIQYDNDTGPDDDSFWEWWTVSDGVKNFKCDNEQDAKWLLALLESKATK